MPSDFWPKNWDTINGCCFKPLNACESSQQQQKMNAIRFEIHKEGTQGPSDVTWNLTPCLAFVSHPDFQNKVPCILSPYLPMNTEKRVEGKDQLRSSVRILKKREVRSLPAMVCLLSGRTKVRTPDSWLPAQEPSWNHQRKEVFKSRLFAHLSVDGKYGSNGSQAVDVGRSVQWVKADHVFPLHAQRAEHLINRGQHTLWKSTPCSSQHTL